MRQTMEINRTPVNYERIVVNNVDVSRLTQALREDAEAVLITFEDSNVRYRIDGGNPDANNGHYMYIGSTFYTVNKQAIREFRVIADGGNAALIVTYYK